MNRKKLWSTMLSLAATVIVLFALGGITVFADETDESQPDIIASGYCGAEGNGENLSWTLDSKGLLTISGTGKMKNNIKFGDQPWFYNLGEIVAIDISEGVTSIGNYEFSCCTSLVSIDVPASVTRIGEGAFEGCGSLASINIPNSVTSIGNDAFSNCESLSSITIPDSVTSIGVNAFSFCTSLVSIDIPTCVTSIGDYAFLGCTSLTSVNIPNSVTRIGEGEFKGCASLTSIDIPISVTSIDVDAFSGCISLASITIPNSVTSISSSAFHGCTSLTSIDIPNSVTSIDNYAFSDCTSLTSIVISNSVTSIDIGVFDGCTSLTSIDIPNSVTSIDKYAFSGCTSLVSIDIPNSVTNIDKYAFSGCTSLTSIDIPNSVTSIGVDAFAGCEKLTKIYLRFASNNLNFDFSRIFPLSIEAELHIPSEYYSKYLTLFSSFRRIDFYDLDDNFLGGFLDIGSGSHIYGYSLSLDGSIGVNFYMNLSTPVMVNIETAYMEFTVNEKTQQIPVKNATFKDGYYIFRCDVVAKEMADKITAQVYLSEGNPIGDAYTYSVQEYAAYIIDHPEQYSYSAIAMVKAMLNYGAASQKYFKHNTDYLANSILPLGEQQSALSSGNLTYYNAGDITPEKISLSLKSTITMKLYFKTKDVANITSFEYRKNQLTTTVSGDYTIVIIEGIPATSFAGRYTIKCYVNESTTDYETVKFSPSNYAYIALKQPVGGVITDDLKEVVRALYQFSLAANEYNLVQPA